MILDLKRIKAERIAKGVTTDAMADIFGWKSSASYTKRENGDISMEVDTLLLIAEVLDYPVNKFFSKD